MAMDLQRGEAGELLPPGGVRRGRVRGVGERVHGGVRGVPAAAVAAAEPAQHRMALRRRRRHLLRLLLHQPRPLRRQVGRARRPPRHARRRRRRRAQGQGLQRPPRARQHRLLLHLRRRAHRDPGHAPVAARREHHHEARLHVRPLHDHRLLPPPRLHRLRRLRQRRPRQHPHRLRLLRALLARRHRQHLRHRPPHRRLPGVCAADLRAAGELRGVPVAGREAHQRDLLRAGAGAVAVVGGGGGGAAEAGAAHHHHHADDAGGDAAALLQRRAGAHRRARLLAALRLLPRQHAPRPARHPPRPAALVGAAGHELLLPPHLRRRQRRLRPGHRPQPQRRHPLQDRRLIIHQTIIPSSHRSHVQSRE